MPTPSFTRLASVTASTKRNPAPVGGKTGAPVVNLASLKVLPLMPVSPEVAQVYRLNSPRENYVTYSQGSPDVLEGDVLVIGSDEYKVNAAGPWLTDSAYLEIIVQKVKGA